MIALFSFAAFSQTGGPYDLSHNVIASGGGSNSSGGSFSVDGTIGQNIAGTNSTGGQFSLRGGFWAFQQLNPTAAMVSVSGKVTTANGLGIRSVVVTITSPNGSSRSIVTGTFGRFRFDDVEAGSSYIISIISKRYRFDEPTRFINVVDNITELIFVAALEKQ